MSMTRWYAPAAAAAVLLAAVAACSSPSTPAAPADPLAHLTADQIATRAEANVVAAPDVRVTGTISVNGGTFTMNLTLARNQGCEGTVGMAGKGSFYIITTSADGRSWIKAGTAFWKAEGLPAGVVPALAGMFVAVPAGDPKFLGFVSWCNNGIPFTGPTTQASKGGFATVHGVRTIVIHGPHGASSYVTDTAVPELVRYIQPGSQGGNVDFAVLSVPPSITPPPASEVFTLPHGA